MILKRRVLTLLRSEYETLPAPDWRSLQLNTTEMWAFLILIAFGHLVKPK